MEAVRIKYKQGWIWFFSIFIFFFNSFLVPEGLTFTIILLPIWFFILYINKQLHIALTLIFPLFIFMAVHLYFGVDLKYYMVSLTMLVSLILFLLVFYEAVNDRENQWDFIYRDIALLNFAFVLISLLLLAFNVLKPVVWYLVPISPGIPTVPRLKLFATEASHYSFLLAPVSIYFYSRALFFRTGRSWFTFLIVTLPLILSFSMGVIAALIISFAAVVLVNFKQIFAQAGNRKFFIGTLALVGCALVIAWFKYPDNILFLRIHNILSGHDTSARGRTFEAFILAKKIIAQKNEWFGIGPGQLKLIGRDIILGFYSYSDIPATTRIPNATAETMVYFGYIGLILRFSIQFYFFFKTRVSSNPYRFWLFIFVFIYQFTGSYITNVSEYILWILAFSNIFPDFSRARDKAPNYSPSIS
jgi:hypothetical protein